MNALVFLLLAVLISAVGSAVLVLRNRRPTSVESGIDEFRREMSALAPPERVRRPPRPARGAPDADRAPADLEEPTPASVDDPAEPHRPDEPEVT